MLTTEQKKNLIVSSLSDAFSSERAFKFFVKSLKFSYQEFYSSHKKELNSIIDESANILRKNLIVSPNTTRLYRVVESLKDKYFRRGDNDFWFNLIYRFYKTEIRPKKDLEFIEPLIKGKKILDFGCGGGYLALELRKRGYVVSTTDILDYRISDVLSMPFRKMENRITIPFPADSFDSAIVKTVLHHIDEEDIPVVIKELRRVARRVVIEEDTYCLPKIVPKLAISLRQQPLLKEFLSMSCKDQKRILVLLDYYANAIVLGSLGVPEINLPFQFKTVDEWNKLFQNEGLVFNNIILYGIAPGKMHKNCQVWLAYDRK